MLGARRTGNGQNADGRRGVRGYGGARGEKSMKCAGDAAPKSGFLGVRLGCGDIHALKRCFILTISLSLYSYWRKKYDSL